MWQSTNCQSPVLESWYHVQRICCWILIKWTRIEGKPMLHYSHRQPFDIFWRLVSSSLVINYRLWLFENDCPNGMYYAVCSSYFAAILYFCFLKNCPAGSSLPVTLNPLGCICWPAIHGFVRKLDSDFVLWLYIDSDS